MKRTYIAILVLIAAVAGLTYWSQKTPPTAESSHNLAQGAAIVSVKIPTLTGTAIIGEVAFNAKCAKCHGKNAAGQQGIAPPLIHRFYRPAHHADEAFQRAAKFGVTSHHWPFGNMPPVKGLTRGDMKNVIAYIRALQKENGIF